MEGEEQQGTHRWLAESLTRSKVKVCFEQDQFSLVRHFLCVFIQLLLSSSLHILSTQRDSRISEGIH